MYTSIKKMQGTDPTILSIIINSLYIILLLNTMIYEKSYDIGQCKRMENNNRNITILQH